MRNLAIGCGALLLSACVPASVLLYNTRSLEIRRGFELASYHAGPFTYDAWSSGQWTSRRDGGIRISTLSPPYTLVIAVRCRDRRVSQIELVAAARLLPCGSRAPILSQLKERTQLVEYRPAAAIKEPYAAFLWTDLLDDAEAVVIEIEFIVDGDSANPVTETLVIPMHEERRRGFTFWEAMMSA